MGLEVYSRPRLTVGALRKALEGLKDDLEIWAIVDDEDGEELHSPIMSTDVVLLGDLEHCDDKEDPDASVLCLYGWED